MTGTDRMEEEARLEGWSHGANDAAWTFQGINQAKDSEEQARSIIKGHEDGDPTVMEMCPAVLSGEWAGESLKEMFGDEADNEEMLDAYQDGHDQAYWDELINSCRRLLGLPIELNPMGLEAIKEGMVREGPCECCGQPTTWGWFEEYGNGESGPMARGGNVHPLCAAIAEHEEF